MRRSVAVLLRISALVIVVAWATPSYSGTIFSNLVQPGNQYGPDPVGVGAIPVPGIFLFSATNFTPAINALVTGIEVPVAVVSGPTEIDVLLLGDSGNRPGGIIESFHLTGLPPAGPALLIPIGSTSHPVLSSGEQYWVAVTGGTPTTFAVWALTLFTGDPTPGGATRVIQNGVDQGWSRNPGTRVGALVVSGDPIPETATGLLIGTGLAILSTFRRMRRRRV